MLVLFLFSSSENSFARLQYLNQHLEGHQLLSMSPAPVLLFCTQAGLTRIAPDSPAIPGMRNQASEPSLCRAEMCPAYLPSISRTLLKIRAGVLWWCRLEAKWFSFSSLSIFHLCQAGFYFCSRAVLSINMEYGTFRRSCQRREVGSQLVIDESSIIVPWSL